jgi:hypothetical protein
LIPTAVGNDAVMAERDPVSPREFVERMPEGESAGPGAPETVEPTTGRPGAGGHGPEGGPGGPAMASMRDDVPTDPDAEPRTGRQDARPDARGAAGFLAFATEWLVLKPASLFRRRR